MSAAVAPVCAVIHGRTISVDVPDASDRAAVAAILGGFPPPTPTDAVTARYAVRRPEDGWWAVQQDETTTHRSATLEDALLALEWQLVTDLLAGSHGRLHLHGAALAHPSGHLSVLVLGDSGAGKTTLTMALITAGFQPHSDDVVLLDVDRLTPVTFPRAFHVDDTTRRLVDALPHDATWEVPGLPPGYFLPATWAGAAAPVGAIFFPRARGHARPLLVGLPVAEAASTLLSFSGSLESDPALALAAAARLTATAPAFALHSASVPATLALVVDTLARIAEGRLCATP